MSRFAPHLTRVEIDSDEERDDGLLYGTGRGRAGEGLRRVLYAQQHGVASRPPPGSVGLKLTMGGQHSQSLLIGAEHPGHRPKMGAGHTVLYDAFGQAVSIVETQVRIVANETIHLKAPTIILEGNIRLGGPGASRPASAQGTIDSGGFADVSNPATKVWME